MLPHVLLGAGGEALDPLDLYVDADVRGTGLGERLMGVAHDAARADGAKRVDLETAHDNVVGQSLYEKLGYKRDEHFYSYSLRL